MGRYERLQEHFSSRGGVHLGTFRTSGPLRGEIELEMWRCGALYIVEHWLSDDGVDVFRSVTDSLKMDDLLAAIK